ncbi:MAG TPA: nicotinate (nicotinamide) nucleotide adenylyltransferase [Terriglobales bacterium]|nr:nicotinate (nicotinamide) nucleotide adenylyltransferase [Terriglobales bacterium]
MNVALFGGTFDPIHRGHLALARAAMKRLALNQVEFIPANVPPHKQRQPTTPFIHRYAMVVLATLNDKKFVPSLLEAPPEFSPSGSSEGSNSALPHIRPSYTIDTVRRVKQSLAKNGRLFFLIGMDAFLDIAKWHEAEAVLRECEFVVASRPGYPLEDVIKALPQNLQSSAVIVRGRGTKVPRQRPVIHLLDGVYQPISSTAIREAAARGRPLARWIDPAVARYIQKTHLYKPGQGVIPGGPARG